MDNRIIVVTLLVIITGARVQAQHLEADMAPLIESSCIGCHDSGTETGLDFESLSHDLSNAEVQRKWVKVLDRVTSGEMPPKSEEQPDPALLKMALSSLEGALTAASLARQRLGRVPARRLTKLELDYTLQDLLKIDGSVTEGVPDEVESGGFDVMGANQRISAVHMESYLKAADIALDRAIQLGPNPYRNFGDLADNNFAFLKDWHEKPLSLGGNITRKLKFSKGFVLFRNVDYLSSFPAGIARSGNYRLTAKVAAYQSTEPVTAMIIVKDQAGGARLVKTMDLAPGNPQTIAVETRLNPGDRPYLTFDDSIQGQSTVFLTGSQSYQGPGLAVTSQAVQGPITPSWPPPGTDWLLGDIDWRAADINDIRATVRRIAPEFFRRPVSDAEVEDFVSLASGALAEDRGGLEALKVTLRSMLSSPQFLIFSGKPGPLDEHALAGRLSYFLWRSMPDDELRALANQQRLHDPKTLAGQVDRMLAHENSSRFVKDFVGQWLRLKHIDDTSPDDGLYPEFDDLLGTAMPNETQLFFASLIEDNLSVSNLIDSNFTYVNRRLAQHYDIEGVEGQDFCRVELPKDSPRGGVLTQAAVLKTTANGTTTSPVTRGSFVLTNFLGTPPSPPPPTLGSIEPDTRGKTTIREILASHRDNKSCNQCHREIDPPGFALESFDPIGGFRTYYRATGGQHEFAGFTTKLPPKRGPQVDPSGITADGKSFEGIKQFKQHLLADQDIVARNFISQLMMFSTGGEIEFADREVIDEIVELTKPNNYPVRDIIHAIIQSRLFTEK